MTQINPEYAEHRADDVFGDTGPEIGPDGVDHSAGLAYQRLEFRDFLLDEVASAAADARGEQ